MKCYQVDGFKPIHLVLETEEEAAAFHCLLSHSSISSFLREHSVLAVSTKHFLAGYKNDEMFRQLSNNLE